MCGQIICCVIYIMPTLLVDCVMALPFGVILMKHLYPLKIVRNRFIRLISHADVSAHVSSSLAKKVRILVFHDLYDLHVAIFMYRPKVFNEMHPPVILNFFFKLSAIHQITRKSTHDFFLSRIRLNVCKRFITFSGVTVWSRLVIETKLSDCLQAFKTLLLTNRSAV